MTAIGVVVLVVSLIWFWAVMNPFTSRITKAEIVPAIGVYVGLFLALAGVTLWLWRTMP